MKQSTIIESSNMTPNQFCFYYLKFGNWVCMWAFIYIFDIVEILAGDLFWGFPELNREIPSEKKGSSSLMVNLHNSFIYILQYLEIVAHLYSGTLCCFFLCCIFIN